MASVCLYFQVHQPCRLRAYSIFDEGHRYFDDEHNREILRRVTQRCYLPATAMLRDLIKVHEGRFRVAFSLTGMVVEQWAQWAPEVIESFQQLAKTGCVEFLAETYHHSLAFLYSEKEFEEQVRMQRDKMKALFGQAPTVFRNTELIYSNDVAAAAHRMGYRAILSEGADQILKGRSPNQTYRAASAPITVLTKNYRFSDDVAFRFNNRQWPEWPLTVEKYSRWIAEAAEKDSVVGLFMDFETLGEHQREETGIFDFFRQWPRALLATGQVDFRTPGQVVESCPPGDMFDCPQLISWADTERDLSAWLGNAMQSSALHDLYALESAVKGKSDPQLLADWRSLQASDHFYYMCTKFFADGDVHKYFNPYESPYDSYINYMNVLDNLSQRAK